MISLFKNNRRSDVGTGSRKLIIYLAEMLQKGVIGTKTVRLFSCFGFTINEIAIYNYFNL